MITYLYFMFECDLQYLLHMKPNSLFRMIQPIFLLFLVFLPFCAPSLLLVDRHNPCRAHGNATVYDITNLVPQWPIPLKGTGYNGQEYIYWWSCAGKSQQCDDPDVSVCQQRTDGAPIRFKAGNLSPQLWFGLFNGAAAQVQKYILHRSEETSISF